MSSYYYEERSAFSFASRKRITYAVQRLILANVLIFAAQLVVNIPLGRPGYPLGGVAAEWLAFRPDLFFLRFTLWQPLTYMFLHAGLWHLFFNMLCLYFFGPDVERVLSTRQFFRFYLLCGALGVLAGAIPWLAGRGSAPVIGASGAVVGVLVAFAVAFPDKEVFLLPFPFPITARALVLIIIVMGVVQAVQESPVSVSTHFGGIAVGFAYMKLAPRIRTWAEQFNKKKPRPGSGLDAMGEAVDNIFKFEDEKRRRK